MHGWTLAAQGHHKEGREQLLHGLQDLQTTGTVVGTRYGTTLLADVYLMERKIQEGLAGVNKVLPTADPRGERLWDAELYRLKGELTLQQEARDWRLETRLSRRQASSLQPQVSSEAEACFQKALEIARSQKAKMWELRAATSLARLWQRQGKREEARQRLAEIYHWFTEGFDTKDLQEARAFLQTLA